MGARRRGDINDQLVLFPPGRIGRQRRCRAGEGGGRPLCPADLGFAIGPSNASGWKDRIIEYGKCAM
jgi:hypothetical protein